MNNQARYTITVQANPDSEDCLVEAEREYIAEHSDLRGYDLEPRWLDETSREWIQLQVPRWHYEAISDTSGT